jgi:hypothetical protein
LADASGANLVLVFAQNGSDRLPSKRAKNGTLEFELASDGEPRQWLVWPTNEA